MHASHSFRSTHSGIVLVSSLLLLLVVTIMALSIFRSFGLQEKIAGNTREKQRALQAAISTQQYAEQWIINYSNAPTAVNAGIASAAAISCANSVISASTSGGQICSNTLPSLAAVADITHVPLPWTAGVAYVPPNLNVYGVSSPNSSSSDLYYKTPGFYITDLGPAASANGEVYQVDAYSFGTSANTVAVVESTFAVTCIVCGPGAL
jgi:type IV pilus assembly protein PilX